jgi:hypothetical protein
MAVPVAINNNIASITAIRFCVEHMADWQNSYRVTNPDLAEIPGFERWCTV